MSYWGRNAPSTSEAWGVFPGIQGLEETALQLSGVKVALWLPLGGQNWGANDCSCIKDGAPDSKCLSCYGLGTLGGFHKYGYNTLDLGSTMATLNYDPTQVVLDTTMRPNRLQLAPGVNMGVITSSPIDFMFYYPRANVEYHVDSYKRGPSTYNLCTVEYSTDTGITFKDMSEIVTEVGPQTLIFQITLSRTEGERSPLFEFLRLRSLIPSGSCSCGCGTPYVLISRTRNPDDINKDKFGTLDTQPGVKYWTLLDFEMPSRSFGEIIDTTNPYYQQRFEFFEFIRSWFDKYRFRQLFSARLISRTNEIYSRVF